MDRRVSHLIPQRADNDLAMKVGALGENIEHLRRLVARQTASRGLRYRAPIVEELTTPEESVSSPSVSSIGTVVRAAEQNQADKEYSADDASTASLLSLAQETYAEGNRLHAESNHSGSVMGDYLTGKPSMRYKR